MNFPPKLSQMSILLGKLISDGVIIVDPDSVWIDPRISVGRRTVIYPNCYLISETFGVIGENCQIGPNAFLRDWFDIGEEVKIGFGAEIVRSKVGDVTKIPHFCHIGDAIIGRSCNIAAGVKVGNYDGSKKHKTVIEDCVFVGIGVSIVAPVKIGAHAYIGAGAIIRKDIEPHDLVVGVNKVVEGKKSYCWKDGWRISKDTYAE